MLHSRPTLVSKPLIPHLPILYLLPLPPTTVSCSWLSFCASCLLSSPWPSQGSAMECCRSSIQEHWTTSLSLVPSCRLYLHPGIQSWLIFPFPDSWILCSALWSHPLPVWHSVFWYHARQQRRRYFHQAGPILFWTFYLLCFFAWSLLWLCRGQHLS